MKLISFAAGDRNSYGAAGRRGVVDLGARIGAKFPDLKALIAGGGLAEAQALIEHEHGDLAIDAVTFLPVITNPGKIFCIGHNYEDHRLETKREKTEHP